jgi:hypothetical protein
MSSGPAVSQILLPSASVSLGSQGSLASSVVLSSSPLSPPKKPGIETKLLIFQFVSPGINVSGSQRYYVMIALPTSENC